MRTGQAEIARLHERVDYLEKARARARNLHTTLGDLYFDTPIGDLLDEQGSGTNWRKNYPEVFGNLGEQAMEAHLYSSPKKRATSSSSPDKKPTKRRKVNLSEKSEQNGPPASGLATVLNKFLKKYYNSQGENAMATLSALGFTYSPQSGDENDCALYTIYHQLTKRHGLKLGDFVAFCMYVRQSANFQFGSMIDILNHGQPLLIAVQNYLHSQGLTIHSLVIDVWAATTSGGLFEYQDVAQSLNSNPQLVLTFYFNGSNYFDSLTGGLCRK